MDINGTEENGDMWRSNIVLGSRYENFFFFFLAEVDMMIEVAERVVVFIRYVDHSRFCPFLLSNSKVVSIQIANDLLLWAHTTLEILKKGSRTGYVGKKYEKDMPKNVSVSMPLALGLKSTRPSMIDSPLLKFKNVSVSFEVSSN